MPDNPGVPPTPAPPASASDPLAELRAQYEQILAENSRLKKSEGQLRNEKGVWSREKEALLASLTSSEDTQDTGYGQPTPGRAPASMSYGYNPPPQPMNVVSREEFDQFRFAQQYASKPDFVSQVQSFARDGSKVAPFIRYQVDAYGRPVIGPDGRAAYDIYGTYQAIAQHMEFEDLRKKAAPANPLSLGAVPPSASIATGPAGGAPTNSQETIDLSQAGNDPKVMAEMERMMKEQGLLSPGMGMEGGKYRPF